MDRILHNPGGPFTTIPDRPVILGEEIRIMFGDQQWATTKNPACAMMIVAALNRDHAVGVELENKENQSVAP
jgi:hypothetical protein